jgi:hypothetical protein
MQLIVDTQKSFPASGGFFSTKDVHWNLAGGGFKGNILWVHATAGQRTHWGEWRPSLPSKGQWEVWVYIPPNNATTTYAQYQVVHLDGQSIIPVNQGGNGGRWEILGTFRFAPGHGYVRLTNVTGELSQSSHHMIAFDAVCWTKIG